MYLNTESLSKIYKIISKRYKILTTWIRHWMLRTDLPLYRNSISFSFSRSLSLLFHATGLCFSLFTRAARVYFFLLSSALTYVTAGRLIEISNIVTRRRGRQFLVRLKSSRGYPICFTHFPIISYDLSISFSLFLLFSFSYYDAESTLACYFSPLLVRCTSFACPMHPPLLSWEINSSHSFSSFTTHALSFPPFSLLSCNFPPLSLFP